MAQIFPGWLNKLPIIIGLGGAVTTAAAAAGVWYYFSPEYTDVGYQPVQPVPYSHALHVGQLGLDCRYCHVTVERSPVANIPPTETCMNCHRLVLRDSPKLAPIVESSSTGRRMQWIRIHNLPDYAYFNHSAHVNAGVGCVTCHGRIDQMEVVHQAKPLSMSWCLDCHRSPTPYLRPADQVTSMTWKPPDDPEQQRQFAEQVISAKGLKPPTDCSGCHR